MSCKFCNKSYVQGCWDANEAASCGNLDQSTIDAAKARVAKLRKVEKMRKAPTKAEIEKEERRELKRLKAKYEK